MRAKWLGVAVAAVIAYGWAVGAEAATLHFATYGTSGTFQSAFPGASVPDTTAAFSFDATQDANGDFVITNGMFTDENLNIAGQKVRAVNLESTVGATATEADIMNTDGAFLTFGNFLSLVNFNGPNPRVFGSGFSFIGPVGETVRGSFGIAVSGVPLPASAPLLGSALLVLGAGGYARRRVALRHG